MKPHNPGPGGAHCPPNNSTPLMATGGDVPSFSAGSPYPTCSSEVSSQAEPPKLESSQSLGSSVVSKDWDTVPRPLRSQWTLATRTGLAKGWFWAHGYDVQARGLDETPVYYAATVLHPGIKWAFLSTAYAGRQDWLCKARELVQALWEREYRDLPIQWQIADSNLPVAVRARESNPFDCFQDELLSHTTREKERIADEFERWLSTSQDVCTKHDNPLPYWSAQRFEYPRVARMAIDVLSIPAMAAECERTFSSAAAMVSPRRTRLDASTVSVAQTVRSWLNAGLLEGYDGLLKDVAATTGTTD
ncbi:hypothetical protein VFPBJ_11447 [Purpureocillium lilacinum]|uniref:HAT C-terminal dimerisation domain-containing protein n=1 Tax=Purpureocillium lilacinum TaxID=33203 RepID=A0A179F7B9_PURLI|nr:hypothetical protein VFPBJ_11447 [Purpureocillium lilacinum]